MYISCLLSREFESMSIKISAKNTKRNGPPPPVADVGNGEMGIGTQIITSLLILFLLLELELIEICSSSGSITKPWWWCSVTQPGTTAAGVYCKHAYDFI